MIRATLVLCLPVVALAGCAPTTPPDVLLIVLDTTGPQLLQSAMPTAQAFVDAGRSWEIAVSPSNSTVDAVGALVQDRFLAISDLAPGEDSTASITLAERLAAEGYSTVLASANEVLDHELFSRGFDAVEVWPREGRQGVPDIRTVDWFIENWEELAPPRFGWLQLDVGHDYNAAPDDVSWPPEGDEALEAAWQWHSEDAALTDGLLADVFALVPEDDGLTVLTADHGEHFGDRGPLMFGPGDTFGHGNGNAPMEILVPLALRGPGVVTGRQAGAVSTLDTHPTILAAAGIAPSDANADLRTGAGARPAGSSLCNLLNLQLAEGAGNQSVWVEPNGEQIVRTHSPDPLPSEDRPPLLARWPAQGLGLQQDWQELSLAALSREQSAFLFDAALPECKGFADLCEDYPELGAIGYIDCD